MNKTAFSLLIISCLLITFISCSNKSNKPDRPVSLTLQPEKTSYVFGDKVSIEVFSKIKSKKIQNIQLFFNNQLIKESADPEFTLNNFELNSLGNGIFKVVVTKTDDTNNSVIRSVKTLSNIEPKIYTYLVVNNYPHLTTSFTEGLEYYNGYLYESTGENGKSYLYQIALKTGQPVKTHKLSDKYFGEGITILNNKIYQLTYHAQKGFIYNLNDFSVIDSFHYAMKEGWGLTNDGKYLIMSDGSHILTWLDPNDFSIVKTLQVANNKDIIGSLNELEYINGTIYANIWTTEVIVQIDPETGKILSYINLSGILNMYKNINDKVDYMNGIAYDKKDDRLFITGKWWPRLFEIKLVPSK